tara:strand:+ start:1596 stop:1793 length:198 start_codon:yes stop_codon:yes gene_type:complete
MAVTQEHLDNLKTALANGVLEVEEDGRRVRYRSTSDLKRAVQFVEGELSASVSGAQAIVTSFSRD